MPDRRHSARWVVGGIGTVVLLAIADFGFNDGKIINATASTVAHWTDSGKSNGRTTATNETPTAGAASSAEASASATPTESQASCIAALPNELKIGQRIMIGATEEQLPAEMEIINQYNVSGAFLLGDFTTTPDLNALKTSGRIPAIVASDEEGGTVQRLGNIYGPLPAAQDVATSMTPDQAEAMVSTYGGKLKDAGIDMVFGPVADVAPVSGEAALGSRIFSSDPAIVTSFASAYAAGWQAAGLIPTYKHFPGLGSATANTDDAPAVTPPLSELEKRDLVPYNDAQKDGVAVMVGNQKVPGLTGDSADTALPASMTPAAYALLRTKYGYADNLVVTDSMSANAIPAPMSSSIVKALIAGADIALVGNTRNGDTWQFELQLITDKVTAALSDGSMTQDSMDAAISRIFAAKGVDACKLKHSQ